MTAAFRFKVIRPFCLSGQRVEVGSIFESTDAQMIGDLLACARIEPADARTAKRVHPGGAQWDAVRVDERTAQDQGWALRWSGGL